MPGGGGGAILWGGGGGRGDGGGAGLEGRVVRQNTYKTGRRRLAKRLRSRSRFPNRCSRSWSSKAAVCAAYSHS